MESLPYTLTGRIATFLENPFFGKEARQFGRRQFRPLARGLLMQAFGLSVALLLFEGWLLQTRLPAVQETLGLWALIGPHGLLCGITGWRLGGRVFIEEHQRDTLEGLRLLSQPPRA